MPQRKKVKKVYIEFFDGTKYQIAFEEERNAPTYKRRDNEITAKGKVLERWTEHAVLWITNHRVLKGTRQADYAASITNAADSTTSET